LRVLASALWLALGSRTRREILSRFASGRLKVGRAGEPHRLVAAATRIHRQDTAWGTSGQLVGGTVWVQVAGILVLEIAAIVSAYPPLSRGR